MKARGSRPESRVRARERGSGSRALGRGRQGEREAWNGAIAVAARFSDLTTSLSRVYDVRCVYTLHFAHYSSDECVLRAARPCMSRMRPPSTVLTLQRPGFIIHEAFTSLFL